MKKPFLIAVMAFIVLISFTLSCYIYDWDDNDDDENDGGHATYDDRDDDAIADDDWSDDDWSDDDDDATDDDDNENFISGYTRDFQTKQSIAGVTVEAINDETGEGFDPPIIATSDESGLVQLELPIFKGDYIGIKTGKSDYVDTVQYHFKVGINDEEFLMLADNTQDLIFLALGYTVDEGDSIIAGQVLYVDLWNGDAKQTEPVGCAEVTASPDTIEYGPHYFGADDLPTLVRDVTTTGSPQNGEGTNPVNGWFIAINAEPGEYTLTSTAGVNNDQMKSSLIPQAFADSFVIADISYTTDESEVNPTANWCTE